MYAMDNLYLKECTPEGRMDGIPVIWSRLHIMIYIANKLSFTI